MDMTSQIERALAAWNEQVGHEEGVGGWHTVDQRQIDAFADATLDHQFIHVDPVKAATHSPYKVPIAHGFLTLSLMPHLVGSALAASKVGSAAREGVTAAINYGLDRVRFPAPVRVGKRVRARSELLEVERVNATTLQLKRKVTFEIEGEDKPGCVAEALSRLVYAE
jgi:acyl dehydratase